MRGYQIGGKFFPSVTTILSATRSDEQIHRLQAWAKRVGVRKARAVEKRAQERGTAFHSAMEKSLPPPQT